MLSKCQVLIADFQNIPIGTDKNFMPNFFDKKKVVLHYENLHFCLRLGSKLKKYIDY